MKDKKTCKTVFRAPLNGKHVELVEVTETTQWGPKPGDCASDTFHMILYDESELFRGARGSCETFLAGMTKGLDVATAAIRHELYQDYSPLTDFLNRRKPR